MSLTNLDSREAHIIKPIWTTCVGTKKGSCSFRFGFQATVCRCRRPGWSKILRSRAACYQAREFPALQHPMVGQVEIMGDLRRCALDVDQEPARRAPGRGRIAANFAV